MFQSKNKILLLAVFIILLAAGAGYLAWERFYKTPEQVFCTQEAKLCPDGSSVGRSGSDCEFAACPPGNSGQGTTTPENGGSGEGMPAGAEGWKTLTDPKTGASFRYPETLGTAYINAFDWPPKIQVLDKPFSCVNAGSEIMPAGKTESRTINGREYCVTEESEGAAGSVYDQYAYAFPVGGKTAILTFTLRLPQCLNYDNPKQTECLNERVAFNIDDIMGRVAESLRLAGNQ